MQNGYEFNSMAFITDGGPVSISVALILLVMSVASWYLIVSKTMQALRLARASDEYNRRFWAAPTLETALRATDKAIPMSRLATQAVEAAEHHQRHAAKRLADSCNQDEFIARTMNRVMAQESARMERGLTVLASVGSVSPFVGLFGTVWGIYHALASISVSGQATLDKVAGPVGEALIMTALGLAVAIPAVLAYNALVRSNRMLMAQLEGFAHELHTLLTTGAAMATGSAAAASAAEHPQANTNSKLHTHLKEITS